MFSCCCTEEDDKGLEVKPLGVAALSAGPDEVAPPKEDRQTASDGSSPFASALGTRAAAPQEPKTNVQEEEKLASKIEDKKPEPPKAVEGPVCFNVDLKSNGQGLGTRLFVMPTTLAISSISSGSVFDHNEANPDREIKINDFVRAVNGKTTVREMAECLKLKNNMTLSIYRPPTIKVRVEKGTKITGCAIHALAGHRLVHIQAITEGSALAMHNARAPLEQHIKVHDCIAAVNGTAGDALAMAQILQDQSIATLDLTLLRPPLPAAAA